MATKNLQIASSGSTTQLLAASKNHAIGIIFPAPPEAFPLAKLPPDLLCEVGRYVSFETCIALRQTCKQFSNAFQYHRLLDSTRRHFLCKAEKFSHNKGQLACYHCTRLLPPTKFSVSQRRYNHSSGNPREDGSRYCIDCGVAKKLFPHLKAVRIKRNNGRLHGGIVFFCRKCSRIGTPGRRCVVRKELRPNPFDELDMTCQDITYCLPGDDLRERNPLFCGEPRLECLPRDIQAAIFRHLDYPSLIAMSQVNAWFHETVDMQQAPLNQKFQFVRHREVAVRQWDPQARACFACFVVKNSSEFAKKGSKQLALSDLRKPHKSWKRRCISCLYRLYGRNADEAAAAEWRERRYCPRCEGLYYHNERCEGCEILGPVPGDIVEDDDYSKLEPLLWSYKHVKHAVRIEPPKSTKPTPPPVEYLGAGFEGIYTRDVRLRRSAEWKSHGKTEREKWRAMLRATGKEMGIFHAPDSDCKDQRMVDEYYAGIPSWEAWGRRYPPSWIRDAERRIKLDAKQTVREDRISPIEVLLGVDESEHPYEMLIERLTAKGKQTSSRGFFPGPGRGGPRPVRPTTTDAPSRTAGSPANQQMRPLRRVSQTVTRTAPMPTTTPATTTELSSAAQQFGDDVDSLLGTGVRPTIATGGIHWASTIGIASGSVAPPVVINAGRYTPIMDTAWTAKRRSLISGLRNIMHRTRSAPSGSASGSGNS